MSKKKKILEKSVLLVMSLILSFYVASYVNLRIAEDSWHLCDEPRGEFINLPCSDYDDHFLIFIIVFVAAYFMISKLFNLLKNRTSFKLAIAIGFALIILGVLSMRFDQITCSTSNGRSTNYGCIGTTVGGQKIYDATGMRIL